MTDQAEDTFREQLRLLFGEEMNSEPWHGFAYTYDGLPHYVQPHELDVGGSDLPEHLLNLAVTAIVEEVYSQAEAPAGYVRAYSSSSSGEADCLCTLDVECALCDGGGTVYIGEGWREVVFVPTLEHRHTIIEAAAKWAHALAWAACEEEDGRTYSGRDIFDVMAPVTDEAVKWATELVATIESDTGASIGALYKQAATKQFEEELKTTASALRRLIPTPVIAAYVSENVDNLAASMVAASWEDSTFKRGWVYGLPHNLRELENAPCQITYKVPTPERFGELLAAESLGTGVGWADDHTKHDIELPRTEFNYWDPSEYTKEAS